MRKPRFLEVKEEPQLVSAEAGPRAQTGRLQRTLGHLLCIKRLSYVSDAVCRLPTWLCGCSPRHCQVLHELNLSRLHQDQCFCAGGSGQGSTDECSGTAAICPNKALFSIPRTLARRPSSPPPLLERAPPAVPVCLHTGSWKAWQRPHPGGFLSGMSLSPSELKRKITHESLVLTWGWDGGMAQSSLF